MADYKQFEDSVVGLTAKPSLQWARYEILLAKASDSALIQLCEHESPIVRSYAFQGLVQKRNPKILEVLIKHIHDTGKFNRAMGCMIDPCYVTDFYLEQVGYFPYDSSSGYRINSQQRNYLDSVMLYGDGVMLRMSHYNQIMLRSRGSMLEHLSYNAAYYKRLREIVSAGVIEALPALAKYNNVNDIGIIKSVSEKEGLIGEDFVFHAISKFPHPGLFSIVSEQVENDLLHNNAFEYRLYKALVQYKTPQARRLLEEAISRFDEKGYDEYIDVIKSLLEKYPDKVFLGLM